MPQRGNSRPWQNHVNKKRQKKQEKAKQECGEDEVLLRDIQALLKEQPVATETEEELAKPKDEVSTETDDRFEEVEVKIDRLSSTGDGLGFSSHSKHIYIVPFSIPGDTVKAKIIERIHSDTAITTDFLSVVTPSNLRHDDLIGCRYFASCSGCQFQMMRYEDQLVHKRDIIQKAYANFSNLAPEVIPPVAKTIGSPLKYGYRTKLTPHFDRPTHARRTGSKPFVPEGVVKSTSDEIPPVGFNMKGRRIVLDIEDCPIGTEAVREGMKAERERIKKEIRKYVNGATLLLRESTKRVPKQEATNLAGEDVVKPNLENEGSSKKTPGLTGETEPADGSGYTEIKSCITESKAMSTEYIGDYVFENSAGAFFQNNNSILPTFTEYIRERATSPPLKTPNIPRNHINGTESNRSTNPDQSTSQPERSKLKYLIDAYCGSGLFTIVISSLFQKSAGIDISPQSIDAARHNATLNNVPNAAFIAAKAEELFASVKFPASETVVVIDPPRKGCDEAFLKQLLEFGPERVIYVSCNVHTQARDVGVLVEGISQVSARRDGAGNGLPGMRRGKGTRYDLESLQGFDFFPQTGHVEGVAILNKVHVDVGGAEEQASGES
ncbi:tRNA(m5U54)methyltransferase [Agyrium rufum]|nr:tRNA(m5U54)methyltransferase [Agyrium rufum]